MERCDIVNSGCRVEYIGSRGGVERLEQCRKGLWWGYARQLGENDVVRDMRQAMEVVDGFATIGDCMLSCL